jgi:hypothetical protein
MGTSAYDATTAIGLALLGVPLGGWFVVYDQVVCKNEPASWALIGAGAGLGASVLPVLAALTFVLGHPVWVTTLVAAAVWAVWNSISSADRRPHRAVDG